MRRSKLEMYVDILKVLVHWGPLKLTHVMYKADVNCSVLEEYLDFLIKQGLVVRTQFHPSSVTCFSREKPIVLGG
jgi:predicted transcriptional regulator